MPENCELKTDVSSRMRLLVRILRWLLVGIAALLLLGLLWYLVFVPIKPPEVVDISILARERIQVNRQTYILGNNWLKQDSTGLWQLYIEGPPFERGAAAGILCHDLLDDQEAAFVEGLDDIIPSRFYLHFLKIVVSVFTRNLPDYVDEEYQKEIYGVSQLASDDFDFIGPKYQRKLNFHAAHDIGHALQTQGLVAGCTMLATNPAHRDDSVFLVGRNFDFYMGDAFARQKLVTFMRPETGIPFAMIGWPGMMGAVSGMNISGIAVALNAGPSEMPSRIGTPVTILARKVLQYASSIEEASSIIEQAQIFVSENIIVASGKEGRVVIFEKSPEKTTVFESADSLVICSNHFQSPGNAKDSVNLKAQASTSTHYRYLRMQELAASNFDNSIQSLANILRNTKGIDNEPLPLGSELSINQLTAHHSVIFDPARRTMWVACSPSQIGPYLAYNLDSIFNNTDQHLKGTVHNPGLRIGADPLLRSERYDDYLEFRHVTSIIERAIAKDSILSDEYLNLYAALNPFHYVTYLTRGKYYAGRNDCARALEDYIHGLTKPLPGEHDHTLLVDEICKCDPGNGHCRK